MIRVWTDGASSPDGRGGWAWVTETSQDSGSARSTTNQRMEMQAVIEAIKAHEGGQIVIYTDSAYVMNCMVEGWYHKWHRNGWRSSKGSSVSNRDLWEQLIALYEANSVTFIKVRGHSGEPMNDRADQLAVAAKGRA